LAPSQYRMCPSGAAAAGPEICGRRGWATSRQAPGTLLWRRALAGALDLGPMLEVRDLALAAGCVPPPATYEALAAAFLERSRRRCAAATRVALVQRGLRQLYRQMRELAPGSTFSAAGMSTLFEVCPTLSAGPASLVQG